MNFAIGISALRAAQFAINTGAQNLANANTPGFHRQRVEFASRAPQNFEGRFLGTGVDIKSVDRLRNQVLESSLTHTISDLSGIEQSLSVLRQIESQFLPGEGSLDSSLSRFFSELARLSANPSESVARNAVIQQASTLAHQTSTIYHRLNGIQSTVRSELEIQVKDLNREIADLVELQNQIKRVSLQGAVPNDLMDQRDRLVNQISEKIDVHRFEHLGDGFALSIGTSSVSIGVIPVAFEAYQSIDGALGVRLKGTQREVPIQSGRLAGLMEAHNQTIGGFKNRLDSFARQLIQQVDQQHAQGVGVDGAFSLLRSTRNIDFTNLPLNRAGLDFPVAAGELFISVTDPQGEKRTYSIPVNPDVDSIQDLSDRISGLPNLQGAVDSVNGQLSFIAQPGYQFDFTGNLETIPGLADFSGTSVPRFSGNYSGSTNRNLQFTVVGNGEVGRSKNLLLRVSDPVAGVVLDEINIGQGYEAGSPFNIIEGVQLTLSAGQVNDGDHFGTPMVAQADNPRILSALGLNSFFAGSGAKDIRISDQIQNNSRRLATSRNGDLADTSNLLKLIDLQDMRTLGENQRSFSDYLDDMTADVGFQVRSQQVLRQTVGDLKLQYEAEINAISGVDPNEELININLYQRQFEAAIRVLQAMDQMTAELMNIVR